MITCNVVIGAVLPWKSRLIAVMQFFSTGFRNTLVTPAPTYKAKILTNTWTKYDPKSCKTRQIRQFGGLMFVHIFALYVGVGVAKRIF